LRIDANLGLYTSTKTTNVVTTTKEKHVKRKYSPRGTRRDSATIRIDNDVRQELQKLADKMGLPVIEVMRLAVERMQKDLENEPG